MELGAAVFTVDVTAAASPLQTSDATAGTVIDNRQIVNLPLNGRDYLQLALISSGTAPPVRSEFRAAQGFSVERRSSWLCSVRIWERTISDPCPAPIYAVAP